MGPSKRAIGRRDAGKVTSKAMGKLFKCSFEGVDQMHPSKV